MNLQRVPRMLVSSLAILTVCAWSAFAGDPEEGFTPMFNGKDLTGWEGKPGWWRVENGCITSESTPEKPCPTAHYLMWRGGKPGDFELRLEYRLVGGNSGVQFRSKELPEWDTSGYQADMEDGGQWTGCLFEHTRGGVSMRGERVVIDPDSTRHVTRIGDPDELLKRVKKQDWNSYRIIALGDQIVLEINGTVMCRAIDRQTGLAAKEGVIALQMHPGPPMKVQFRNLRIKLFDPPPSPPQTAR
ncbi:MAG: DUF1080 domain-containing protein [Verrucomicrobia bacterium]|nr:DUF1080 domain-containing protein [Verrucomicrobiota bacterium]MDI9382399.1 DUF1080 domain-containing protein [Verrucomicrobiota bacterium]NMD20565.1 DUF1080 domain-containing protein [Verrucomicrobiota bacterium]HNU99121.1 DUF1080 domain-containing protein [Verrucomicrobiota bacterium]HOA60130.1 DUF1080 domain-containing protein [Verrucomicrobiota bacterium]